MTTDRKSLTGCLYSGWIPVLLAVLGSLSGNRCAAESPGSAAPQIRNVLFIISDDLKASVLGCYGDPLCRTPNIDRLAAGGLVFERSYCQGVSCAPSRTSLMFSRYKGQSPVNLGQHFREHGWYSARVGKIYHMRVPGDIIAGTSGKDIVSSWTEWFNSKGQEAHTPGHYACLNLNIFTTELDGRQSTRMPHRMFVTVRYEGDGSDQPDHRSATKAVELLRKHQAQKFFLAVGLIRPHYPMVAPQQFFEPYPWQKMSLPMAVEGDLQDIPKAGLSATRNDNNPIGEYPANQKRMWAGYYASVAFMDAQVGRILDGLEQLGLRDSTAVIFTSDHGYHLGEHGFWQKTNLHEEVTRVPLIISVPGLKPGRSQSLAELIDIYPTLAELAGLDIPGEVQGRSLVPVLKDHSATVRQTALSLHSGYGLRSSDWAFLSHKDGTTELYDMRNDPRQFTNLAGHPGHRADWKQMRTALSRRLTAAGLK